ncbi:MULTISPECIES: DUF4157 domain-containing protein [unclassified Nostoc]|uniref:eCIS core domain-containing protein n=1 Tax=unclassified Nostoc TaxID=2593658 RepID=UPI002AD29600|nr:DUF4157 domain-containing protein [Nostoc sp. DedQUE03]MDZ7977632.1 DUF4157 domain-containing protein [Nostoc sp. DedQUE03]MDZ8049259.1 DUF4157 domain-containing protein [Nostoc sp. DedQUE02]
MHKTKSSKTDSSTYSNSSALNSNPQLAHRSFGSEIQKASIASKTPTDIENEGFAEQQMEATGLSIQAKYGTITPEGQERLTVLQAKMDGLLNSRLEHASRFGYNIANIPLHRPDTSTPIQTKLTVNQPGDVYEQEADNVAQQVMQRMGQPINRQSIQREALPEDEEELQMKSLDNSTLQRKTLPEDEEELQMKSMVQRQGEAGMAAAPDLEASINQGRGGGVAIADNIREPMEVAFGADFSGVKVHTDGQSDQLNRSIQARAFTTGQDVFFRSGEYNLGSRGGQELLAHELTHVVQQTSATLQRQAIQRLMATDIWQQSTQSKIFNRGNNNPELIQIDNLLNTYHELTDANDPNVEQRLQVLTNIETTVYGWYNRRFNRNKPSKSKRLTAMYDLLDDIAQEHETLVTGIANNNMRLPIPNVNNNAVIPNSPEDAQLQQLWQSIVNETGNINFSTQDARQQEDYPDFKQKMLPIFARLLRTSTGRQLLTQISTTQPTGLSNEDQAAGRGNVTVRPVGQQEKTRGRIAAAGVKKYEAYRQGNIRPNGGIGIGSYLTASAYDSETDVTRRGNAGIDTNTNPLLSPMFVILAHEMIHVLHNLRGQNRNQTSLEHWGNEEEKVTISGEDRNNNVVDPINEQAIRNEYGLNQPRYGHDE